MNKEERLVRLEVGCGVSWLLMDGSWLMEWQAANLIAGIFAIICAIAIFFYVERRPVPILVCCAGTCWLVMNFLWSVGDLAELDSFISTAQILFFVAIAFMTCAFWISKTRSDVSDLVLRRVRILRSTRS